MFDEEGLLRIRVCIVLFLSDIIGVHRHRGEQTKASASRVQFDTSLSVPEINQLQLQCQSNACHLIHSGKHDGPMV